MSLSSVMGVAKTPLELATWLHIGSGTIGVVSEANDDIKIARLASTVEKVINLGITALLLTSYASVSPAVFAITAFPVVLEGVRFLIKSEEGKRIVGDIGEAVNFAATLVNALAITHLYSKTLQLREWATLGFFLVSMSLLPMGIKAWRLINTPMKV